MSDRKKPSTSEKHQHRGERAGQSGHFEFRPYRVDPRTGKTLWAKHYGLKAWPIWVPDEKKPDDKSGS
jgi:hypothetical protein